MWWMIVWTVVASGIGGQGDCGKMDKATLESWVAAMEREYPGIKYEVKACVPKVLM